MHVRQPHGRKLDLLPDWTGQRVALVASGPSANAVDLSILRGKVKVAAVNTSWELVPWCDLLYACDLNWWQLHRGAAGFAGLKVTQDRFAADVFDLIRCEVVPGDMMFSDGPVGRIGAGHNSGFQLLNLVAQLGVTGVLLIGFDLKGDHWHGRHPTPCHNPDEGIFQKMRLAFETAAPKLAGMGVDVINCSDISTIRSFRKLPIRAALEGWGLWPRESSSERLPIMKT